ncbi:hypothetical protein AXF42_Ash015015 [Apostasia shenzhenica]|uniref:Uncharacterized protein n=1 Tax=Apostasia shenzhenica TaxID=1088818 RepID=A0A2I0B2W0_9ASPA|nr:hypothetical protein AXF42_Ash015015 [Apostasia shenzhenica]
MDPSMLFSLPMLLPVNPAYPFVGSATFCLGRSWEEARICWFGLTFACNMAALISCFAFGNLDVTGGEDERVNSGLVCLVLPQPSILATAAATTPPSSSLQSRPWISDGESDLPPAHLFPSSPSLFLPAGSDLREYSGEGGSADEFSPSC